MFDLANDLWTQFASLEGSDWIARSATGYLRTFSYVAARLAGVVLLLPFATGGKMARHLQFLLIITLSLILTPVAVSISPVIAQPAPFGADWLWSMTTEFALGASIGLGMMLCLSALQMAGELIDQQMGLRPQQILLQSEGSGQSITGQFLFLTGTTAFLSLPAIGNSQQGGLLLFVDTFMQTFHTLPAGFGNLPDTMGTVVIGWVQHSISLSLLVAAPILACAMLVAMFVSVVNRSVPDANTMMIGFPLRTIVCLTVLLLTLSGITTRVTQEIPLLLENFQSSLTGQDV
ncbi:MAG: flagellar biosynthetic protein FliR [Planctomycetaceae bacterium]|jgi:flagellar biosynthesis protein FliR|nr:flagellar biosynthetic protein FliR [Planctomycetaceae bacterium]MDC0273153.1 flagellar biosynthetic protein FliR [Planctomycetaceae bacterium]MDG2390092.1 flagellar biosynthetic protein FliR [Planctomycetaceae bacterium]